VLDDDSVQMARSVDSLAHPSLSTNRRDPHACLVHRIRTRSCHLGRLEVHCQKHPEMLRLTGYRSETEDKETNSETSDH
jgi:hypothetical protein